MVIDCNEPFCKSYNINKSADGLCLLVKVFGTEQRNKGKGRLRETTLCRVGTCRIIIHFFTRVFSLRVY